MTRTGSPEQVREFSPAQYIAPYLLLIIGNAGTRNAPLSERPVLFWVFTATAALGALSAVIRLKRMWITHQRRSLPAWTRFLGLLLALYVLFVAYRVTEGITG